MNTIEAKLLIKKIILINLQINKLSIIINSNILIKLNVINQQGYYV